MIALFNPKIRSRSCVAAVCARWSKHVLKLAEAGSGGLRAAKEAAYFLKLFRKRFGKKEAADITNAHLAKWLSENPTWKSPSTKNHAIKPILAAFKAAAEADIIPKSRLSRRGLKLPQEVPRTPLREDHYQRLMKHARFNGRKKTRCAFRCAVYFLHETGARPCEMRNAEWKHVNWKLGTIELTEHKTATSTGTTRIIPLTDGLVRLLRWWYRKRKTGWIFRNGRDGQWGRDTFGETFRNYAKRAGIPKGLTAYCLRHGFICDGLEQGVGQRQLADVVGHKKTDRIDWYSRSLRTKVDYIHATAALVRGRKRKTQG